MMEFLSNPAFLSPQIDFLLKLQEIRNVSPIFITKFLSSITILGEVAIPALICAIFYWCVDFRKGLYFFCLMGYHFIISTTLKMMACVYRPWVLSDKIKPVEEAIAFAKGYSFPSGHSSMVASLFGGIAFMYKKHKFLCLLLILTILTVAFSRMWLGVHTPQDVIVGLLLGFILVFVINFIINWAEKNTDRYLYFSLFTNIISVFLLIFFCFFRQYPLDYVNGQLLVNPMGPLRAQIVCIAFSLGIINGVCLCRRFFPFNPKDGSIYEKILRALVGTVLIYFLNQFGIEYCFSNSCRFLPAFVLTAFVGFFITAIYPFIFIKFRNCFIKNSD